MDLSYFSALKTCYRDKIASLARYDDVMPVKKIRFVECYNKARDEALTDRVIRSGWKATGIHPWNPQKAIESSQVVDAAKSHSIDLTSSQQLLSDTVFDPLATPRNVQQLKSVIQNLPKSQSLPRDIRRLLAKTTKAFSELHVAQAFNERELAVKDAEIEKLAAKKKRTKVERDPNTDFANLDNIKEAMDKVKERQDAWDKKDRAREAAATAAMMTERGMSQFMTEFHVNSA